MTFENLNATEKITRAKIQLGYNKPFWSYLVMHGNYELNNNIPTIGVNNTGKVIFNEDFINSLTEAEVEGVLCHEIFHVAFQHLNRLKELKNSDAERWNIATDIVTNNELQKEGFSLPKNGIVPVDNSIEVGDIEINDIDTKTAERIYGELSNEDIGPENQGFDDHSYSDDKKENKKKDDSQNSASNDKQKDSQEDSTNGKDENKIKDISLDKLSSEEPNWKEVLVEAATYAKQKGQLSKGVERMLGELLNPEIDWRNKLYKYITASIPYDYTYSRPSKKSLASGIYIPSTLKEAIDVVVGIDVSGSISQKEYNQYITEIISIAKSFRSIKMTLITWDTQVNEIYKVENGNIDKIKDLKLTGGGGTNINAYFKKIKKAIGNPKLVVTLTDGFFGEITESLSSNKLWVLSKGYSTSKYIKDGEVIQLK